MRYFRSSRTETQLKKVLANNTPIIVFDTETTGIEDDANIIQLSAQKVIFNEKGEVQVLDAFNTFINPRWPLPSKIIEITHITDDMLADAPVEEDIIEDIDKFFGDDSVLAAYNAEFDIKKMVAMYKRCNKTFKCKLVFDVINMVRDMNKRLTPTDPNCKTPYNLGTVLNTYHLDEGLDFHKSDEDVKGTIRIMQLCIKNYYQNPNVEGFTELEVKSVSFPTKRSFTPSHKDNSLYISTNQGLVYYNTFYKYFASSEIDLRFVNILKLEDDVCALTGTTPQTLYKYKRQTYQKFV